MRLYVAHVEAEQSSLVRISSILAFSSKVVFFFSYSNLPRHLTGNSLEDEAGGVLNADRYERNVLSAVSVFLGLAASRVG